VNSATQCGKLREYLGFDFDYPDDDVICEEVKDLEGSPHFSDLDGLNVDNEDEDTGGPIVVGDAKLIPPGIGKFTVCDCETCGIFPGCY
jgi:hypothetical protein